jgi:hypothetical protein
LFYIPPSEEKKKYLKRFTPIPLPIGRQGAGGKKWKINNIKL